MYYFNARWYDAESGRFISEDPVGDPNNPNLYTYCSNNPLNRVDPTGLFEDMENDDFGSDDYYGQVAAETPLPTLIISQRDLPDFKAPDAWEQYQKFWQNLPTNFYESSENVSLLLFVLWTGIDTWGDKARPQYGWGSTKKNNHADAASMNMVRTIQAAAGGLPITGYFGDMTVSKMQSLGYCTQIRGKKGEYYPVGQAAINVLRKRVNQIINSEFVWPTTGYITSPYDPDRPSFTTKDGAKVPPGHRAIDIANTTGTPIVSMGEGTVVASYWSEGSGWILDIDYGGGVISTYHHLREKSSFAVGTQVFKSQVVAYMGNTGKYTTGPHLHFAIKINGTPINPNNYLPPW